MEAHRYAEIFPILTGTELQALADDIRQFGLRDPIWRFEGKILDGRNRAAACEIVGVKPDYRDFTGTSMQALQFVRSENMTRRHLTPGQGAACAHEYEMLEQEIMATERQAAEQRQKTGKGTDGSGGRGKKKTCVKELTQVSGSDADKTNRHPTDSNLAKTHGTNRQYVADVRRIAEVKPELVAQIKSGEKTVPQAKREVINEQKTRELEQKAAAVEFSADQPLWTLIEADVMDGLQSVLDHHAPARLVFADPPYNIGIDYGDGENADMLPAHRYMMWVREWLDLSKEVLSPDGSLWVMIGDEYAAEYAVAIKEMGLTIRAWIKWYETFGVNCSNNFNRCSRHVFYAVKDSKRFVFNADAVRRPSDRQAKYTDKRADPQGKIEDDVWQISRLSGTADERISGFPTQLPLKLVTRIVCCASDPGDLVVDPFSGSATTGVAAIQNQRKYVGIEKSRTFIDLSDKRLKVAS